MTPKHIAVLAAALVACGGAAKEPVSPAGEPHQETTPGATEANKDIKEPGEAKPGDTSRCTVTGEELVIDENTPHAEHDGKTYYFCCMGCKKKFEADPSKFTKS